MRQPKPDAHWRDSARPAKLWVFDARAAFPLLMFIVHIRMWTFVVALSTMVFLSILNHYGFSVIVFARWLRSFLAGRRKIAVPWWM